MPELDPQDRATSSRFLLRSPLSNYTANHSTIRGVKPDPIARLEQMEAKAAVAGGEARIAKQHEAGKLTARERDRGAAR